ncbi:sensor histidine kinase [Thiocapsa roseopersicina]|uniref:histidine kinase n=1 Tax=Thiocapsa roseopersicina TaxID=1058 RepID=A0A1H3CU74_THIRO|nr:ATP-binding protein [Thiocapsa roseopersicina]SDX56969.1 Cyclic nucleotide-binding domain-containing protein [Thiocapsa roseopersicina]
MSAVFDRAGHEGSGAGDRLAPLCVLIVASEPLAASIGEEVARGLSDIAEVVWVDDGAAACAQVSAHPDRVVPLVLITASSASPGSSDSIDTRIATLDTQAILRRASVLLLTDRALHDDLSLSVDCDRLHAVIRIPGSPGILAWHARAQTVRWLSSHRPTDPRTRALVAADGRPVAQPESDLLRLLELDTQEVAAQLLAGIERVLGPRPRLLLPAGTRLIHEGVDVDAVLVVLRGRVALDHASAAGDLRLHHDSTGSVVGLLSLAQQQRAFFTARATTEVEVVHLSFEQLDRALAVDASLGAAMAAVSIRALAKRLRRADQLQVEKTQLNHVLERERRQLSEALRQLEQARLELVEQARYATLGEMAAGIAHELNNPVAAMLRATTYVGEDLERVLASHPQGRLASEIFAAERDRPPRSTREERAARRRLEVALGDAGLAQRLFDAGIEDPERARALAADPTSLDLVEAVAGIGSAVRNLEVASRRMCELVTSLRAYARPKGEPVAGVDLHAGLEDTLRLMAHRLRDVEIERSYGDLPPIRCHPGELEQLWTNLLVNARDALGDTLGGGPEGRGRIALITDAPDASHVRVQIRDNGRGIDPDILPRVFEPRFTTKQGAVRYGLGLGLAIARRIVDAHGGTIELSSRPGCTRVTITLPVAGPPDDEDIET